MQLDGKLRPTNTVSRHKYDTSIREQKLCYSRFCKFKSVLNGFSSTWNCVKSLPFLLVGLEWYIFCGVLAGRVHWASGISIAYWASRR